MPLAAVTTRKKGGKNDQSEDGEGGRGSDQEDEKPTLISEELDEVVFKLQEGKAVKTIVKTGISDFERIEILSGLNEGDEVVSGPFLAVSKRLKDGNDVEVKKEEDKKDRPED